VSLHKLYSVFLEGLSIPINFDVELKPLHTVITMTENWLEDNFIVLNEMKLFKENKFQTMLTVNGQFAVRTDDLNRNSRDLSTSYNRTGYLEFVSIAASSSQLTATFETQKYSFIFNSVYLTI
jgi:hypothetical protein